MESEGNSRIETSDETTLRSETIIGVRSVEFPPSDADVHFVSDEEYRRVMAARRYDPDADFHEFLDAEDFTCAIRVRIDGVDGLLCTT